MKQHITEIQLRELSPKAERKLNNWWEINYFRMGIPGSIGGSEYSIGTYFEPLLSIGQMIEFLEDSGHWTHNKSMVSLNLREDSITNICDTLWDAVKEELEK